MNASIDGTEAIRAGIVVCAIDVWGSDSRGVGKVRRMDASLVDVDYGLWRFIASDSNSNISMHVWAHGSVN